MLPSLLEQVGGTPLVEIDGVHVKMECTNPSGSVKDRIAAFMLTEGLRRGELHPGDTVVEATSGNTGIALALAARELGCRSLIFMPEHMSEERRRMMERAGAEVRLTPRAESFAGACARRDEYQGRPGFWIPDQFANPDNVRCHRETTGAELVRQLLDRGVTRLGAFVAGVGTGGTLMGVGEAVRAAFPGVRVVAVEPTESAVMSGGEPGDHGIMGIGDGFVPPIVDRSRIDEVLCVSTAEAVAECKRLRGAHGWCVGVSAGANLVAASRLFARGLSVATVWPDSADRYESVGLDALSPETSCCPLAYACRRRMTAMLEP
ncbi:MAG TPA: cysteine synthase family protein [Candidatus Eisenbacteria bacterium]|jgi:cysteine synthase A